MIRLAHIGDLPAINKIYNQAVAHKFSTAHLTPVSQEWREQWFAEHPPDRFPVYVFILEGRVTGWVSLSAYRAGREALAHVAEVSYYVDQEQQGRGTGTLLLEHSILVSPSFGFKVLIAILLNKNPASIALLNKFGFSRWGVMPGIALIDDQEADHLYYGLTLP